MIYCSNCGSSVHENTRNCSFCGQMLSGAKNRTYSNANRSERTATFGGTRAYSGGGYDYNTVSDDIAQNRNMAALCYFIFFIPMLTRPRSDFVRYHVNQGAVLTIFSFLVNILAHLPLIGWIIGGAGGLFTLFCILQGVQNAISGQTRPLPVIGIFRVIG